MLDRPNTLQYLSSSNILLVSAYRIAFGSTIPVQFELILLRPNYYYETGLEKNTIKAEAHRSKLSHSNDEVKYEADFEVEKNFGEVGGIFVTNEHHKEMYFKDIVLSGFPNGPLHFTCNSWVHSKTASPEKRVFFGNKSYLPSQTPSGLKRLREKELETLRGNGKGERKTFERIYDYDKYNDLGNPDKSDDLSRPVLGGKDHPYPRRCRTGRGRSKKGL
ncbi:linoleate 13S-lipoxygenase 2-1, chloroplastic-like [Tasmannia lanceolata]|uniref:linoleate 13S-lipoxygenase 2-1, chloroplastic-like n=1 Tax=Tasmannia lanceolata TaxID=3420 RepID=UPI004063557D